MGGDWPELKPFWHRQVCLEANHPHFGAAACHKGASRRVGYFAVRATFDEAVSVEAVADSGVAFGRLALAIRCKPA